MSDASEIAVMLPTIAVNLRVGSLLPKEEQELSASQLLALLVLGRAPTGTSATELAGRLGISLPALTAVADRLSNHGLLRRHRDSHDRRVVYLTLSGKGLGACERVRAALETSVARALEDLDPAMRENLLDAVRKVSEFSEQFARGPAGSVA